MGEKIAIIVDLNSIRLVIPKDKLEDWKYIHQLAVAEIVDRVNNGDGVMEGYEEDYDQTELADEAEYDEKFA